MPATSATSDVVLAVARPHVPHSATRTERDARRGRAPSARPMSSSRRMTSHQSAARISPSAIARMTSVDACEPELPPVETIIGRNSASSGTASI